MCVQKNRELSLMIREHASGGFPASLNGDTAFFIKKA